LQGLVYVFIALAALGLAAIGYFVLTFTPIEAFVVAVAFGCLAVLYVERQLRLRVEGRLEKAVGELSRLLSTDAQAGSVLSQRINALSELKAGARLDSIEADLAVLGGVVRQVAEAVADFDEQRRLVVEAEPLPEPEADPDAMPEPVIPLDFLRRALDEDRLVFHLEPVVSLPQRNTMSYDLVPRLEMEDGHFADRPDYTPRRGGEDLLMRVEAEALDEAIRRVRRARLLGTPIALYVPLSVATLGNGRAVEVLLAGLETNRGVASSLSFVIEQAEFRTLQSKERAWLATLSRHGVALSLAAATTLRIDYADLQTLGFRTVRIDATRFLRQPESFTDFHPEDVAAFGRRFGIEIVASGVIDEQQVLRLFENGLTLAQGPYIAAPGPFEDDLLLATGR
jgi:cyclic-di-GMP phosphodiesterase TipF (flagellum assembly factor)